MNIILKLYTLFWTTLTLAKWPLTRFSFAFPLFTFFCFWLVAFGEEQQCAFFSWGGCFCHRLPRFACARAPAEPSRSEALLFVGSNRSTWECVFPGGVSREYDVFAAIFFQSFLKTSLWFQ